MNAPAPRKVTSPEVSWTPLPGTHLTLRFSIKAVAALKDLWGLRSEQEIEAHLAQQTQSGELGIDTMTDMIWAATRSRHPEMTRAQVLDILDDAGLASVWDLSSLLEKLMGSARPEADQQDLPGPRGAAAPSTHQA